MLFKIIFVIIGIFSITNGHSKFSEKENFDNLNELLKKIKKDFDESSNCTDCKLNGQYHIVNITKEHRILNLWGSAKNNNSQEVGFTIDELLLGNNVANSHRGHKEHNSYSKHKKVKLHSGHKENVQHSGNEEDDSHSGNKEDQPHSGHKENEPHSGNEEDEHHPGHKKDKTTGYEKPSNDLSKNEEKPSINGTKPNPQPKSDKLNSQYDDCLSDNSESDIGNCDSSEDPLDLEFDSTNRKKKLDNKPKFQKIDVNDPEYGQKYIFYTKWKLPY